MPLDRDHEDLGGSSLESVEEVDPQRGDRGADAGGPRVSTPSVPIFWQRGWGWTELSMAPGLCASASGLRPVVVLCTSPHPQSTAASRCSVLKRDLAFAQSLSTQSPRRPQVPGPTPVFLGFPGGSAVKNPPAMRETWV